MTRQPFVDLAAQYRELRAEILPELERIFMAGACIGGEILTRFDTALSLPIYPETTEDAVRHVCDAIEACL